MKNGPKSLEDRETVVALGIMMGCYFEERETELDKPVNSKIRFIKKGVNFVKRISLQLTAKRSHLK